MIWFLAGVVPPILWATVNHIDKYLLSKTKHHSTVDVLMVYSTGFSLVVLPFLLYFSYSDIFSNLTQVIVQLIGGVLLTLSVYFYLVALNKDEASVVLPFALLTPVFGYLFSYSLLGETLSSEQIIACVIIIAGALVLSLEFGEERKIRIRHGVVLFMSLCASTQAAQETIFKFVTIENSFVVSVFWLHVGIALCGLVLLLVKKGLWGHFRESVRVNGGQMFALNFFSEGLSAAAYMVRNYAILLAPIAIIMTLNAYQPVFVLILGVILTIFAPKFVTEKIKTHHLLHKGLAIGIILVGSIMLGRVL